MMAYMTKDGKGPYPNKAGEFCGNATSYDELESDKRRGRPQSCKAGTSKEMAAKGFFGVYLIEDSKDRPLDGEYDVPTPAELMEPEE